jgi:hypothetical protein
VWLAKRASRRAGHARGAETGDRIFAPKAGPFVPPPVVRSLFVVLGVSQLDQFPQPSAEGAGAFRKRSASVRRSIRNPRRRVGDGVVTIRTGTVGQLTAQLARHAGGDDVLAATDQDAERRGGTAAMLVLIYSLGHTSLLEHSSVLASSAGGRRRCVKMDSAGSTTRVANIRHRPPRWLHHAEQSTDKTSSWVRARHPLTNGYLRSHPLGGHKEVLGSR